MSYYPGSVLFTIMVVVMSIIIWELIKLALEMFINDIIKNK